MRQLALLVPLFLVAWAAVRGAGNRVVYGGLMLAGGILFHLFAKILPLANTGSGVPAPGNDLHMVLKNVFLSIGVGGMLGLLLYPKPKSPS